MKDGGPAFPIANTYQPWNHDRSEYDGVVTEIDAPGMSLRDWFAGQALAGLMVRGALQAEATAYLVADAMLREREKQS